LNTIFLLVYLLFVVMETEMTQLAPITHFSQSLVIGCCYSIT